MAAREPDNRITIFKHSDMIPEGGESKSACGKPEERRKRTVGNYWGFSLQAIFTLSLTFYKEMNGKAFNPTYEEKLRFCALHKLICLGPYTPTLRPDVGFFDVLGNDRRKKWAELGSMARDDAMEEFVKLLNSCCSHFSPYVTSHHITHQHERRSEQEEQHQRCSETEKRRNEAEDFEKQQAMVPLNVQTPVQFQQHDPECVEQTEHTHYGTQQDTPTEVLLDLKCMVSVTNPISQSESSLGETSGAAPKQCYLFIETKAGEVPVLAPSMWTMPQINTFKAKMQQDTESVIAVGRGEVLTVHIPTHKHGTTFFWEFATDDYDIAFGLYFEWPNTGSSVRSGTFVETGQVKQANETSGKETRNAFYGLSEVVPLFRRDSHECVYAGSHQYPSQGVYLLRFDNSYSLWRSKVVYYRVCYTS